MIKKGIIFDFWPVKVDDDDNDSCVAVKSWRWDYFGWLFHCCSFLYFNISAFMNININGGFPVRIVEEA